MSEQEIIKIAKLIWAKWHEDPVSGVSEATKRAIEITKEWQESCSTFARPEVTVVQDRSVNYGGKIDLVFDGNCDGGAIAFELKSSSNNVHHEFYKDVLKVLVYNESHNEKIEKLVFLSPKKSTDLLRRSGLYKPVERIVKNQSVTIELISVGDESQQP